LFQLNRARLRSCLIHFLLIGLFLSDYAISQDSNKSILEIEEVTTEDVKRFLVPTVKNSVLEHNFQANFLPQSAKTFLSSTSHWLFNQPL
jgi:hypothetical protein